MDQFVSIGQAVYRARSLDIEEGAIVKIGPIFLDSQGRHTHFSDYSVTAVTAKFGSYDYEVQHTPYKFFAKREVAAARLASYAKDEAARMREKATALDSLALKFFRISIGHSETNES